MRPGYQAILEGAREGGFDVVVAEALDRLSRDQEDIAALFKRLQFAGVRLVTLGEGEIGPLHIGLKGTMNALFIRDLADKVRRGVRGRIRIWQIGRRQRLWLRPRQGVRPDWRAGARRPNDQRGRGRIVCEIFSRYAAGKSPRKIAFELNARAIPAPRGSAWSGSTLNGNRGRGTGILNNENYVGRRVWNRLCYAKDPETGKRRSRANASDAVIAVETPNLAIVPRELWEAVKARQAAVGQGRKTDNAADARAPFWSKQRPRYFFPACCGAAFAAAASRRSVRRISAVRPPATRARQHAPTG